MDWKCVEKDGIPSDNDFPVVFAIIDGDGDFGYVNAGFINILVPYTHWSSLRFPDNTKFAETEKD